MILNTRPTRYRDRFHAAFGVFGLLIVDCPVLSATPTNAYIPPPHDFDAVIFTSQQAVALFPATAAWRHKTVYAVGPITGDAARGAGFADVVVTGHNAAELSRALAVATFARALYPSATDVAADLELEFPGRVQRVAIYATLPRPSLPDAVLRAVADGRSVYAPLFSRRSAAVLSDLLGSAGIRRDAAHITAIGASDKVLSVGGPWRRQAVAANPTLDAVAAATRSLIGLQQ